MENLNSLFECIADNKMQSIDALAKDIMHTKDMHDAIDSEEMRKLYREIALLQLQKLKEMLIEPLEEIIKETKEQDH